MTRLLWRMLAHALGVAGVLLVAVSLACLVTAVVVTTRDAP